MPNFHTIILRSAAIYILCLCAFTEISNAQSNAVNMHYRVGQLDANNPYLLINIFNNSAETVYFLEPGETGMFRPLVLDPPLAPGQYCRVEVLINPKAGGKFNETVTLTGQDKSSLMKFRISGKYHGFLQNGKQNCPDFSKSSTRKRIRQNDIQRKKLSKNSEIYITLFDRTQPDPTDELKPNNLVILLDASSSMKEEKKQEFLHLAFRELSTILRPIDQITVISYSSQPKTLLPPEKGGSVTQLIEVIEQVESEGYTNGGLAIKKAFETADSLYDPEANNEIILATDGAFNLNETDEIISDVISLFSHTSIRLSILGIENQPWAVKEMKNLATAGNGKYIRINSRGQAKNSLRKTIKIHSKK